MRRLVMLSVAVASVLLVPAMVFAQASIAGVVKDTSGALLPGVTVEASSPALIERTRSSVTDATGQFQIVNLVPGIYSITYSLAGFTTVKREGIELSGSFTATVNAELRIGAITETITVTGETPVIDVQSTTGQRVIDKQILDNIPSARTPASLGVLIPGMSATGGQDIGGSGGNGGSSYPGLSIHGGSSNDQITMQNGVPNVDLLQSGFVATITTNPVGVQEVVIDTSAVSAEHSSGGVRSNVITRDGGNVFKGTVVGAIATSGMQGSNYTSDLQNRGLKTPDSIKENWDFNPGFGGPLQKDRVWFFLTGRYNAAANYAAGMFYNQNENNPNAWTYVADTSRPAFNKQTWKDGQARLTWQATAKNKFGLVWHEQVNCFCQSTISSTTAPEASIYKLFPGERQVQVDWTSPLTGRLLLQAGTLMYWNSPTQLPLPGLNPLMITVSDQASGLTYRSGDPNYRTRPNRATHSRAIASYITGAHAFKVGFTHTSGWLVNNNTSQQPVTYRFNNGVPNQITELAYPYSFGVNLDHMLGLFAQDRWTVNRLTLSYGVRYDWMKTSFPEETLGPTPLTPNRNVTFPDQDNLSLKDITPKLGVSYDLFGTGKTAVKASLNRYLQNIMTNLISSAPSPAVTTVLSTTRSWTDTNRNFVPDCNLTNPAAQTVVGGDVCGALASQSFGSTQSNTSYDPSILQGWGKRGYNWEFSAGVQHELFPRVSLDVAYFRRWYGNQLVTDSQAYALSDFTQFSVVAPADTHLPNGGGYTVSGLYNLNPNKFGLPSNDYVTFADNYGSVSDRWNGLDVSVNARPRAGVVLAGGVSTGRRVTDECAVASQLPEMLAGFSANGFVGALTNIGGGANLAVNSAAGALTPAANCHQNSGFLTQVKFLGTYTVPKVDVLLSAVFQSIPGPQVQAFFVASNAAVAPSLGRPLSGGAANVTVDLVAPGSMYGERLNQLDLRFGKIVKLGRWLSVRRPEPRTPPRTQPIAPATSASPIPSDCSSETSRRSVRVPGNGVNVEVESPPRHASGNQEDLHADSRAVVDNSLVPGNSADTQGF